MGSRLTPTGLKQNLSGLATLKGLTTDEAEIIAIGTITDIKIKLNGTNSISAPAETYTFCFFNL